MLLLMSTGDAERAKPGWSLPTDQNLPTARAQVRCIPPIDWQRWACKPPCQSKMARSSAGNAWINDVAGDAVGTHGRRVKGVFFVDDELGVDENPDAPKGLNALVRSILPQILALAPNVRANVLFGWAVTNPSHVRKAHPLPHANNSSAHIPAAQLICDSTSSGFRQKLFPLLGRRWPTQPSVTIPLWQHPVSFQLLR